MEKLLKNITETTRLVWRENEEKIFRKYGEYRYRLVVNGLGVVEIIDLKAISTIARICLPKPNFFINCPFLSYVFSLYPFSSSYHLVTCLSTCFFYKRAVVFYGDSFIKCTFHRNPPRAVDL